MKKYEIIKLPFINGYKTIITRTDEDGTLWTIPEDERNSDYQEYLAWVEEGNEAEIKES
jgi:hypothetical protein